MVLVTVVWLRLCSLQSLCCLVPPFSDLGKSGTWCFFFFYQQWVCPSVSVKSDMILGTQAATKDYWSHMTQGWALIVPFANKDKSQMLASLEDLMLRVKVGIIFKSASDRHSFPHLNILQNCHVCFSSTFPLHHYIIITYMQYGTSPYCGG